MKKTIPFKKDIIFNTSLAEVTSISLDHTLKINTDTVLGNFIISGDYKVTEASIDTSPFNYEIPFKIAFDSKYNLDNASLDIEDFYYEIVNNSNLLINIEVGIDGIEEQEEIEEEILDEKRCVEPEEMEEINDDNKMSFFDNIVEEDTYKAYKIYIIREGDTIDSIIQKYTVNKELLEKYNDLSEIKLGDKIIIPIQDEGN